MTEITADLVRQLREMTGAPMMDTKRALQDSNGDIEAARQLLRERGMASAASARATNTPEGVVLTRIDDAKGTIVAIGSETEPVSKNDEFRAFARPRPGSGRGERARTRSSRSRRSARSCRQDRRERHRPRRRPLRDGYGESIAAYVHPPANKIGVLVRAEGSPEAVRRLAMHIAFAAPRFATRDEVPEEEVASERSVYEKLPEVESKPEQAREKIVEGMLGKRFFAERRSSPTRPGSTSRRRPSARRSRRKASSCSSSSATPSPSDGPRGGERVSATRRAARPFTGSCSSSRARRSWATRSSASTCRDRGDRGGDRRVPAVRASRSRSSSARGTSTAAWPQRPRAWTGRPRITRGCSRRCSTRSRSRTSSSASGRTRASCPRSAWPRWPSRTSVAAGSGTSRRGGSSSSPPAPATRSSRRTRPRRCARSRSGQTRS